MTIEFLPFDVDPASPIYYYQENFEEIERIFPLTAEWIDTVELHSIINTDGTILPFDWLPIDGIRSALDAGSSLLTSVGFTAGLYLQWRDDTTLYAPPGQVAHRAAFKMQGLDAGTGLVRVIDVIASARDPAADLNAGLLFADTWYYVYAKLDVASAYPEYRVSRIAPTNDEGFGREHPAETALRFLTVFRTGSGGAPAIRPYHVDGSGRYFWREILLGPIDPAVDLAVVTAGFEAIDISAQCPPIADMAFLTWMAAATDAYIRTTDDITNPAGYYLTGSGQDRDRVTWLEVPVNVMDDATGAPIAGTTFDLRSENGGTGTDIGVVGFHVSRE